jgi:hypothetical protein
MRKDPNTIYLFLWTIGKGLKQRITRQDNSTSSSSAAGACKAVPSDWDEKGGLWRAESYRPELTWWTTKPVWSCHLLRVPQQFHCTGHQSKTKVSSEHRAHNEPKNLSPGIAKEGLSLSLRWNTGDQAKNDHNTIGFKRAMLTKTKLTLIWTKNKASREK